MDESPAPSSGRTGSPASGQAGDGVRGEGIGVKTPGTRTPKTERELIEAAMEQAHTPRSDGYAFRGDLPPAGTFPGYELIREVHRGGQGAVFLAVQLATKRRVAIKLMHGGPFRGSAGRARFEREVQILGQLNHPNIVRIHDSGATTDGSHFYVMDYVSGRSLDEVISSDKRPTIEETLKLFLKICDGINAAHLKGIIHRDIKPSNVRISTSGEPVVVDFGLAKVALPGSSGDAGPIMSMTGQFIGSLPWASPEQAQGVHENVDVRTDVYSLGVVLYQLLTGKFPYDVIGNMRDVLDRILRTEPARPSTVRRQVNDEVETIVLKCLAKDRDRRYQSAGELARDIERYLAGQPIEAKRDSVLYVITKTARRYWAPVAVLATIVVLTAVFGVVMTVLYREKSAAERNLSAALVQTQKLERQAQEDLLETRRSRDAEREAKFKAEQALDEALAPARQMIFEFDPMLKNLVGATRIRQAFLDRGEEYLNRLTAKVGADPLIEKEVAAVHQRLGEMMSDFRDKRIGDTDVGAQHVAQAMAIREKLATARPNDALARADLARSVRSSASLVRLDQKPEEARDGFERSVRLFDEALRALDQGAPERRVIEEDRANALLGVGSSLARLTVKASSAEAAEEFQKASEARYAEAATYWTARRDHDATDLSAAHNALSARGAQAQYLISSVAARLRQEKKFERAYAVLDRADAIVLPLIDEALSLVALRPNDRTFRRDLMVSLHYAGWSMQERADAIEAEAAESKKDVPPARRDSLVKGQTYFTQAAGIAAALESSDLDDLQAKRDVALLSNKLGNMLRELGKLDKDPALLAKASAQYDASLAIRRALWNADPILRNKSDLVVGLTKCGDIARDIADQAADQGRARELVTVARDRYQEALGGARELIEKKILPENWGPLAQIQAALDECEKKLSDGKGSDAGGGPQGKK